MFLISFCFADTVFLVGTLGANIGQTQAVCDSSSISVATSRDDPGYSSFPSIGGSVTGVQLFIPQPLVPRAARRTATITFTASQAIGGNGGPITISWPPGYFYGYPIYAAVTDVSGNSLLSNIQTSPLTIPQTTLFPIVDSNFFDGVRLKYVFYHGL
jgi:hypothetical protein